MLIGFFAIRGKRCVQHKEIFLIQHVWFAQNGVLIVRRLFVIDKHAIIPWIINAIEKAIYGLKKTIYGFNLIEMDTNTLLSS